MTKIKLTLINRQNCHENFFRDLLILVLSKQINYSTFIGAVHSEKLHKKWDRYSANNLRGHISSFHAYAPIYFNISVIFNKCYRTLESFKINGHIGKKRLRIFCKKYNRYNVGNVFLYLKQKIMGPCDR